MRRALCVAIAALLSGACDDAPRPAPPRDAAPPSGGIRPLTSRDNPSAPPGPAQPPSPGPAQLPPGHPPVGSTGATTANGGPVAGTVSIAGSLKDRKGSVLFIIARSAGGQVVAVRKEEGVQFPFSFQISASDAMMEGTVFTGPFDITARLSRTGDAMPAQGDLEGTVKGVAAGSSNVTITLDSVRQ